MVYLAGDNDLETYGVKDLGEMKAVGSTDEVAVVAEFDRMSDQVTRRYYLTANQDLEADCVAELPEVNTGDPKALVSFATWACQAYPAERYALVLWNHGAGWKDDDIYHAAAARGIVSKVGRGQIRSLTGGKPSRALFRTSLEQLVVEASERAILFDDSATDFLDNQELKCVLEKTVQVAARPLDLLGFDACLMNMLEVHYQVRDLCRVVVGSQEVEPGDGWPYDAVLARLVAEPAMTAEELAQVIVDEYVEHYATRSPSLPVTQSAVSVASVAPLAEAVSSLGRAGLACLSDKQAVGLLFGALRYAQSFTDRDYIDLGHFCGLLAQDAAETPVGAAAQRVVDVLASAASPVLAEAHHGPGVDNASGLSIYLPVRVLSPLYSGLDFAKEHRWDEFLTAFVHP